ncbi:MAG: hypothetical protein EOP00_30270 [Pedobacter sp.]|nr:MAG: hypothetical protein EOP00_30270 [Pedobacter sp.]
MRLLNALAGGFAGAIALNLLHETVRKLDTKAPRIDLLGEEALNETLNSFNAEPLTGNSLYLATLTGDVISNGLYYSLIGLGKEKNLWLKGASLGVAAGFGAIEIPKTVGLNDEPVTKTNRTKILTIAWYLIGGLVAAAVIDKLQKTNKLL